MWRPSPRWVLAAAFATAAALSAALGVYVADPIRLGERARVLPFAMLFVPAATAVLILQAIAYPSAPRRLVASVIVFVAALVLTVFVYIVVGCAFYAACTR